MLSRTFFTSLLLSSALLAAPPSFEKPTELKAAQVLPATLVNGTNSQVLDPVDDDGYLNTYRLKSKSGELKVVSTATLYERAHEFDAIAQMQKLKGSTEFTNAVKGRAGKVVEGAENLVTDPLGTAGKAVSGVGRLFRSVGSTLGGGTPGGDSTLSEASGFSSVKRAYARKFGVDPYSRNPYLQSELKDISQAGFLGGTMTSLGLGMVGGAAGAALTVVTTTQSLSDMMAKPPQDVADYNSDRLRAMGVDDDTAELFLNNENFTITERTAIVMALDSLSNTKNRAAFIKFAVLTHDPDVASFRRRQADLYATYHAKVKPIQEFRFQNPFACGVLADGSLLIMAPVDHLLWTPEIATYVTSGSQKLSGPRKLLWLTGTASPLALQNLSAAGWQVQQKASAQLK